MMTEPRFMDSLRDESDEYLRRHLANKRTDSISIQHKNAVKLELERRAKNRA